jgi:hypothetical protein
MAEHEFYKISCPRSVGWWFVIHLISSIGGLAVKILRKLSKLIALKRGFETLGNRARNRMTFDELSAVSDKLISLTCKGGIELPPDQADLPFLQFPRLENVVIWCKNASDLQLIATILENSISSSGHNFLKKLYLSSLSSDAYTYQLLSTSLTKVIKVSTWFPNCSVFIRVERFDLVLQSSR